MAFKGISDTNFSLQNLFLKQNKAENRNQYIKPTTDVGRWNYLHDEMSVNSEE